MKLSHSKLSTILSCPMSYYLSYVMGISKKDTKPALAIGSSVHWGIEHNTEDLTDYWKNNGSFRSRDDYGRDQLLAEAMVHGYMKHKDEIFEQMLTDPETGDKLQLIEETHELYVTGKLKSKIKGVEFHDFVGIVDLLLLTDKGFIIIDYKTSSQVPDWNNYLDQIYRYIFLLQTAFPEVPVIKVGIINIRKTGIRQKKTENMSQFLKRMQFEYEVNDEDYVVYHEYPMATISKSRIDEYVLNLSKMADTAQVIADGGCFYINFTAANGPYRSDFWDIFYKTPGAEVLYKISDRLWDAETGTYLNSRDCNATDMEVIDHDDILNKYSKFKEILDQYGEELGLALIMKDYIVDENLFARYYETYCHEKTESKQSVNSAK